MIYDIITFNGEEELFEIRYNILKDYIDEFRVVEFDKTFSGKPKPSVFNQKWPKVRHYYIKEDVWSKYKELAISSPNTQYGKGAKHWITEFCQKESIKDVLLNLKNEDICFIGDCDEIWDSNTLYLNIPGPAKLKLKVYSYYLDNRSNEDFWGTIVIQYKDIKNECLNHIRVNLNKTEKYYGWHFTSIGGYENVKKKLTDSYTEDSYASQDILNNLENNINGNKDFLNRQYSYRTDQSEWPKYLSDNKSKYRVLLINGKDSTSAKKSSRQNKGVAIPTW